MKFRNHNLTNYMEKKDNKGKDVDVVTVVRKDGKEFLIKRKMLAEHINRGFTVKNKADQPSEEELKNAVGYREAEDTKQDATVPEENGSDGDHSDGLDALSVSQLRERAEELGIAKNGTKAVLIERIQKAQDV